MLLTLLLFCSNLFGSALLELLELSNITHDNSLGSIVEETQKAWLRKPGDERWDIKSQATYDHKKNYRLFSQLGMMKEEPPARSHYEVALILGATVEHVRARLWYLRTQTDLTIDQIVILTGDRPLHPELEGKAQLIDPFLSVYPFKEGWSFAGPLPTNETEMVKLVFAQLDLPAAWNDKVLFIDAPTPEGKSRPNTRDTFCHWLNRHPLPNSALVISTQPFLQRAKLIAGKMLPTARIDSAGPGISYENYKNRPGAYEICLDELARILYEMAGNGCKV